MNELEMFLQQLKSARVVLALAKSDEDAIKAEIAERLQAVSEKRRNIENEIATLETTIRNAAVALYSETGCKKPADGVEVKLFTECKMNDQDAARNWCFDNLPAALKLDTAKVEKYAKEFGDVPGVEIVTGIPRAQIASKL